MPAVILPLSVLGALPFIGLGLAAVGNSPQTADTALIALIDYGALVLAFAGGVHWGLAMAPDASRPTMRALAGIIPLIAAWVVVLLAQTAPATVASTMALIVLILAYLATALTEHRAAQRFMLASRYVWVRWGVTVVAVVMMCIVLILRGLGQTIVL